MRGFWRTLGFMVGVSLLCLIKSTSVEASSLSSTILYDLTDAQRQSTGLTSLSPSSQLESAARAKAEHMFTHQYWAHYAPDGMTPWDFIADHSYEYTVAGENLAMDFETSEGVMSGWLNSPSHRQNIMDDRFSEIGIAVVSGDFKDHETAIVVALYAKPKSPVVTQKTAKQISPATANYSLMPVETAVQSPNKVEPQAKTDPDNQFSQTKQNLNWETGLSKWAAFAQLSYRATIPSSDELIST